MMRKKLNNCIIQKIRVKRKQKENLKAILIGILESLMKRFDENNSEEKKKFKELYTENSYKKRNSSSQKVRHTDDKSKNM